jgi:hypothetical protein
VIAPWEISAPDRSFKQNVPDNRQSARRMKKYDMPRRMPRAVDHLKIEIADLYPIPIHEPAVGRKCVQGGESKHSTLSRQLIDPECVVPMRPLNGDAVTASIFSRLPAVVDMPMCQHDLDQSATRLRERFVNRIQIATRVDRGRLTGSSTHDNGTVLGEGCHRNDCEAKFGAGGCRVSSH